MAYRVDPNLINDKIFRDIVDINNISPQIALVKLLNNLTQPDVLFGKTFYDAEIVESLGVLDFGDLPINTKFRTDKIVNNIVPSSGTTIYAYRVRVYSLNTLVPDTNEPLSKLNEGCKNIFKNFLNIAFYTENIPERSQVMVFFADNSNFQDCYISEVITQNPTNTKTIPAIPIDQPQFSPLDPTKSRASIRGSQSASRISTTFGAVDTLHPEGHGGVDVATATGTPVFSGGIKGRVIRAGYNSSGFGNLVVVRTFNNLNSYNVYYAHLNEINVRDGQEVDESTQLGTVGTTGRSSGPHLHIEARKLAPNGSELKEDGKFVRVDPQEFIILKD
jgi:murein DD-endopeptidase MepM/ murein hydrolase activator NlpD